MVSGIISKVFAGIAVACLLPVLYLVITTSIFISQASVADGTVVEPRNPQNGVKYRSVIQFTTSSGQNVQYTTGVSSSPPEFSYDQKVRIYYDPNDPAGSARADSFVSLWFWPALLGFLGTIFGLVSGGLFLAGFAHRRKINWLEQKGQPIVARITDIRLNTSLKNKGKSPYVVLAQWHDPAQNKLHHFRSDSIWYEPTSLSVGNDINVLVDPNNPDRYQVILK